MNSNNSINIVDGCVGTLPPFKDGHEQVNVANEIKRRVSSFEGWSGIKTPTELAIAGFRYTGVDDKVQCDACGLTLHSWLQTDDPVNEHRRYSPKCSFIRKWFTPQPDSTARTQYQPRLERPLPKYPQYQNYKKRLDSFNGWPYRHAHQSPPNMARAGFFFHGIPDRVRCFQCGLGLRDWDDTDYPMACHKLWSPDCHFVNTCRNKAQEDQIYKDQLKASNKSENIQENNASGLPGSSSNDVSHISAMATEAATTVATATAAPVANVVSDPTKAVENNSGSTNFSVAQETSDDADDIDWSSPKVNAVLDMGYTGEVIRRAICKQRERTGQDFKNAIALYQAIQEMET